MVTRRTILAGVIGGIAMFIWSSIAHMVLPLASAGIREISNNEPGLLDQMHGSLGGTSGLYLFPSSGWKPGDTSEQKAAAMKNYELKLAGNPSGLLIYHPPGAKELTAGQLITEFIAELVEALLAVFLLAQTGLVSYPARVGFVLVVGFLASLPTNVSYWNWYGFPAVYTAAYMTTQIVGFLVVGLVASALIRQRSDRTFAVAA
ncbi:MAG: hypothetical protein JOY54_07465 [Acidobacteriaceae bacterium]|nr:hypothetical protein [Acidobacteriaceae bacterium]